MFLGMKCSINQANNIRTPLQNIEKDKCVKFGVCVKLLKWFMTQHHCLYRLKSTEEENKHLNMNFRRLHPQYLKKTCYRSKIDTVQYADELIMKMRVRPIRVSSRRMRLTVRRRCTPLLRTLVARRGGRAHAHTVWVISAEERTGGTVLKQRRQDEHGVPPAVRHTGHTLIKTTSSSFRDATSPIRPLHSRTWSGISPQSRTRKMYLYDRNAMTGHCSFPWLFRLEITFLKFPDICRFSTANGLSVTEACFLHRIKALHLNCSGGWWEINTSKHKH